MAKWWSSVMCGSFVLMAGSPKKRNPEIELEPDAWPRFERFIKEVTKAGPQHRKQEPKSVVPKGKKAKKAPAK